MAGAKKTASRPRRVPRKADGTPATERKVNPTLGPPAPAVEPGDGSQVVVPRHAGGRPPQPLKPEYCERARLMAGLGATILEIADAIGHDYATLMRWARTHPEFLEALKLGQEEATDRVERALFHRAIGYSYDSEKIFNDNGTILRVAVREHLPPDPTSAIFWLKSKRKSEWMADRQLGDGPDNPLHIQIDTVRELLAEARTMKRAKLASKTVDGADLV